MEKELIPLVYCLNNQRYSIEVENVNENFSPYFSNYGIYGEFRFNFERSIEEWHKILAEGNFLVRLILLAFEDLLY